MLVLTVILLVVGMAAATGRLPGNSFVGIRVPEVRKSPELWRLAHRIAGPFWVFGAAAWALGACFAFIASGWLWVLPAFFALLGVYGIGRGAAQGAHTVAAVDARKMTRAERGDDARPAVDLSALRRAAGSTDGSGSAASGGSVSEGKAASEPHATEDDQK